jgi:hypothetical protein
MTNITESGLFRHIRSISVLGVTTNERRTSNSQVRRSFGSSKGRGIKPVGG